MTRLNDTRVKNTALHSEMRPANNGRNHSQSAGLIRLIVWGSVLAVIWFGLLPWWARQPRMNERLEWLDERGIDPSAMYYTELEAMKPILKRLHERERANR